MSSPSAAVLATDPAYPNLAVLSADPVMLYVEGFLTAEECAAHREAAERGELRCEAYADRVALDADRLRALWGVPPLAALPQLVAHAGEPGGVARAAVAVAVAAAAVGALTRVVPAALQAWLDRSADVAGKSPFVHTGTKFLTEGAPDTVTNAAATEAFLERVDRLMLGRAANRCEPPTVTRYLEGERQRLHNDCRTDGAGEVLGPRGQRLANVLVYLTTNPEEEGGATSFDKLGVAVQPKEGDALVFFPAFADGTIDTRMTHESLPIRGEGSVKWILNTWVCER